jgi:hypothetical protein
MGVNGQPLQVIEVVGFRKRAQPNLRRNVIFGGRLLLLLLLLLAGCGLGLGLGGRFVDNFDDDLEVFLDAAGTGWDWAAAADGACRGAIEAGCQADKAFIGTNEIGHIEAYPAQIVDVGFGPGVVG